MRVVCAMCVCRRWPIVLWVLLYVRRDVSAVFFSGWSCGFGRFHFFVFLPSTTVGACGAGCSRSVFLDGFGFFVGFCGAGFSRSF